MVQMLSLETPVAGYIGIPDKTICNLVCMQVQPEPIAAGAVLG